MTKLSDTQSIILSAAAQREDGNVLPLPDRLKGGAAKKVVGALIGRGLVAEVKAGRGDPVWRETDNGQPLTLVATEAAEAALGIEPVSGADGVQESQDELVGRSAPEARDAAPVPATAPEGRKTRTGTKQAALIAMLEAPEGASIAEITAATGWRPHSVRGAIAGALKKRLGLNVISEKVEGRGTVYRIV